MADDTEQNNIELRAQGAALLAEARARAAEVQRALSELPADSSIRSQLEGMSQSLAGAEHQLGLALSVPHFPLRGADLAQLGSVITTPALTALVASVAAGAENARHVKEELAAAAAATRAVSHHIGEDLFTRRIFDPFLRFESEDEERAYREREAERQRYIAEQQARNSPVGDLNVAGAMQGQMLDAHAHGAGDSSEWQSRWNTLADTVRRQRAAMQAAGQSTAEYDEHIRRDVRRFLKSRHLTDEEIEGRLAATNDPLDAVKPFLKSERDAAALGQNLSKPKESPSVDDIVNKYAAEPLTSATAIPGIDELAARMRSSGIKVSDVVQPTHGVPESLRPAGDTLTIQT